MPNIYDPKEPQTILQLNLEDLETLRDLVDAEKRRKVKPGFEKTHPSLSRIWHQIHTRHASLTERIFYASNSEET